MPNPTRRDLFAGAVLGTAAAFHPEASAAILDHPLRQRMANLAEGLRTRWAHGAEDMGATFLMDREGDHPLHHEANALRQGFSALEIFKEIENLSIEEQVQSPIQNLLTEIAMAVGQAILASTALTRAYVEGEGADQDPDEHHLLGAIGALRIGVRSAKTTYGRQQMLENTLNTFTVDKQPGALRSRLRRILRRNEKAEALASRIAEDPSATGVLQSTDPDVCARIKAAQAESEPPLPVPFHGVSQTERSLIILGMLALGIMIPFGVLLVLVGGCLVACEGPGGVILLLIGIALTSLTSWGMVTLKKRLHGPVDGQAALPQLGIESVGWADLDASKGWVSTGLWVDRHTPMIARAWGVVRGGRLWAADAEGDGVVAGMGAPLPGAPARALIGRIGEQVFFVGAEQRLPDDLAGMLELGINVKPEHHALLRGGFTVQVLRSVVST